MGENINTINNLLQDVAIIQKKYDEHPEKNGEKFNVFSVMAMEHSEVNTHSAIIGELLNPSGSHGQGDVFLKLFIEELKKSFDTSINLVDFGTLVNDKICERTINIEVNWENVTGGRIDLIVEDDEKILIIENKLYAIDQEYQLIRYNNYAKNRCRFDGNVKDVLLFYLTLNGKELNNEKPYTSEKGLNISGHNFIYKDEAKYKEFIPEENTHHCLYYPISYEIQIKNWLEKCLTEPDLKPLLKATLKQYLSLIKKITFQTMSEELKKEIVDSILIEPIKSENVRSAFAIVETIENLKKQLYYDFIDNLKKKIGFEKIEGSENIDIIDIKDADDDEYCGVYLNFGGFKKNTIGMFFGSKKYSSFSENVFFGFRKEEGLEDLIEKFENKYDFISSSFWIYKNSKFNNWDNSAEIWEEVAEGKNGKVYQEIISVINEILDIEKITI